MNEHFQQLLDEWDEGFYDAPGSALEVDPYCPWAVVFLGSYTEQQGTLRLVVIYPDLASAEVGIFTTDLEPVILANLESGEQQEIVSR